MPAMSDVMRTSMHGHRLRGRTALKCSFCHQTFYKTEHLKRHERSHTKERPFRCETCGKHFGRNDTLLRHEKTSHGTTQQYTSNSRQSIPPAFLSSSNAITVAETAQFASVAHGDGQFSTLPNGTTNALVQNDHNATPENSDLRLHDTGIDDSWWLNFDFEENPFDMSFLNYPMPPEINNPLFPEPVTRPIVTEDIQSAWFSYIRGAMGPVFDRANETSSGGNETSLHVLDDDFRIRASERLQNPVHLEPLPSTGLLNLSIKAYFDIFAPLFPIIHRHTFKPSSENAPLLLLMSAIGCLLVGDVARTHGVSIFDRYRKSIMTLWDSVSSLDNRERIILVQSAVLSQIFGLLSGDAKHLEFVDSFHGTAIAWARRLKMFQHKNKLPELGFIAGESLHSAWLTWAHSEEAVRTANSLYILDSHIAAVCNHDPLLRHDRLIPQSVADEDTFDAPNESQWRARILANRSNQALQQSKDTHDKTQFSYYVKLQNIQAMILETRSKDLLNADSLQRLCDDLISWYQQFTSTCRAKNEPDKFHLIICWHACFLHLLVDFDRLERALGRDGRQSRSNESDMAYAVHWSKSIDAARGILHAYAIQSALSEMLIKTEPAFHVPHCAFLAGVIAYSCLRFRHPKMLTRYLRNQDAAILTPSPNFPEFNINGKPEQRLDVEKLPVLFEDKRGEVMMRSMNKGNSALMVGPEIFKATYEALERIGHWDIARAYSRTLRALVYVEIESWMSA